MFCGSAGATVAIAFMLQASQLRVARIRGAQRSTSFDDCAIAMTAEINLRMCRGWPGTSPTQRCLWGEPRTVISSALLDVTPARMLGQQRGRGFVRWKRLLLVAGGLVRKWTSPKDHLSPTSAQRSTLETIRGCVEPLQTRA